MSVTTSATTAAERRVACKPNPTPATASAKPIPPISEMELARSAEYEG